MNFKTFVVTNYRLGKCNTLEVFKITQTQNKNMEGFDIVKIDIREKVMEYADKGAQRGVYLGFPEIKDNYSMSLPGCTDWTGFPGSGKTQVLMEFLLFTAQHYNWRHLVYFPDVGTDTEVVCDLLHKITGKTFDKRYNNVITDQEIDRNLQWVLDHFIILTKVDLKAKLNPMQFWDYCADMNQKLQGGVQTGSIDSWKDMNHNEKEFGRTDQYLEHVLSYRNSMAQRHNQHYHTIIHPLKTMQDANGVRRPPGAYDLKGGSEWFNNGKCMVTVHRPNDGDNIVELFWNKIKPRSVGLQGTKNELLFDPKTFRYYCDHGGKMVFAEKKPKVPLLASTHQAQLIQAAINLNQDDIPF